MPKTIFTDTNILKAYYDCRKTKRNTINALKYEMNVEDNLAALKETLIHRSYQPGRSICFVVTVPKPREIFAAEFGDRVVHHILVNQVQPIWENNLFIPDSYACRPGKGHHFGMLRLWCYTKQFPYYGIFDIANFFGSIDKSVLFGIFKKTIEQTNKADWWKEEIVWLAKIIIFHNPATNYFYKGDPKLKDRVPPHKSLINKDGLTGMPIGNLTSQFLANVYLNELDHFVVDTLKIKGYGRYVDDFVIFADKKQQIQVWRDCIDTFLAEYLHVQIHPRKAQIQPTHHGVPFVGYFIKPWGITIRRNVVKTLKKKMYGWNKRQDMKEIAASLNSYYGHFLKAKSSRLRKHLIEKHLNPEIKTKLIVQGSWKYIKLPKRRKSDAFHAHKW